MDIAVIDGVIINKVPVTKKQLKAWLDDLQDRKKQLIEEQAQVQVEIDKLKAILADAAIIAVKEAL